MNAVINRIVRRIVDTDIGEFVDPAVDDRCCCRGFTILLVPPEARGKMQFANNMRLILT